MANAGILAVRVTSAGGSIPLPNVLVRVRGHEGGRDIEYSILTDRDGLIPPLTLPAPSSELSLSPHPTDAVATHFDVEVIGAHYYRKNVFHISIFPNIITTLPVNLIPMGDRDGSTEEPIGAGDVTIPENENLA